MKKLKISRDEIVVDIGYVVSVVVQTENGEEMQNMVGMNRDTKTIKRERCTQTDNNNNNNKEENIFFYSPKSSD